MDNPILWVIIIGVPLIILVWLFVSYNNLQRGKIKVKEAESGIDVALSKRYDVLTKMVEVVKGYTKHETETLTNIVALRNSMHLEQATILEKQRITQQLDQALRALNVVVEQYPDLKASENYKQLQLAIQDVEEHLQAARRVYNANVSLYNQFIKMFPSNIVANMFHFVPIEFFETEEFKRQDVEIKF